MIFLELFITFFLIGLFTFGGGYAMIPMIQEQVVAKGWISIDALTDFIAISEVTPGPFAINISTFVGNSVAGVFGSLSATIGVITPSIIIIIIIAIIMNKFIKNKYVQGGLNGVRPIVVSLIASTSIVLTIKNILFNGTNINYDSFNFDVKSFTLLIELLGFYFIYKKVNKKGLSPFLLLIISGLLGLFIFI